MKIREHVQDTRWLEFQSAEKPTHDACYVKKNCLLYQTLNQT